MRRYVRVKAHFWYTKSCSKAKKKNYKKYKTNMHNKYKINQNAERKRDELALESVEYESRSTISGTIDIIGTFAIR